MKKNWIVSKSKARFQDIEIEKQQDNTWKYTKDPFHRVGVGTTVGTLYENFMRVVRKEKTRNDFNKISIVLCNSAYAAELWVNKVITTEMVKSIETFVALEGKGMTPLVVIPHQQVVVDNETFMLKMIVTDSFSHKNFEFLH